MSETAMNEAEQTAIDVPSSTTESAPAVPEQSTTETAPEQDGSDSVSGPVSPTSVTTSSELQQQEDDAKESADAESEAPHVPTRLVEVGLIDRNTSQPRKHFDQGKLQGLANSINRLGLLQPIVVRDMGDGRYEIVVGERRWRAMQLISASHIEAKVIAAGDEDSYTAAVAENAARANMTPTEEASAFDELIGFGKTPEEIAEIVGQTTFYVQWRVQLVHLTTYAAKALDEGRIGVEYAYYVSKLNDKFQKIAVDRYARGFPTEKDAHYFANGLLSKQRAEETAPAVKPEDKKPDLGSSKQGVSTEQGEDDSTGPSGQDEAEEDPEVAEARRREAAEQEKLRNNRRHLSGYMQQVQNAAVLLERVASHEPDFLAPLLAGEEGVDFSDLDRLRKAVLKARQVLGKAKGLADAAEAAEDTGTEVPDAKEEPGKDEAPSQDDSSASEAAEKPKDEEPKKAPARKTAAKKPTSRSRKTSPRSTAAKKTGTTRRSTRKPEGGQK
ncbi:ParB/RepB/Spo0J family partition protein [Streptomyces sp. TR02-1]|uniref:ParB/RepB/Spo0J family partition protein n=1 Tax=Streptomyces sp. TR02-1 TaxID=3385977 RepID=UPI0039A2F2A7